MFRILPTFCLHNWSQWSEIVNTYSGSKQFRNCKKCNKVEYRVVGFNNDVNTQKWNTDKSEEV